MALKGLRLNDWCTTSNFSDHWVGNGLGVPLGTCYSVDTAYPGWQPVGPHSDQYRFVGDFKNGTGTKFNIYRDPAEEVQEMSDKKQIWEVVVVWEDCDGEEDFVLTVVREPSREVAIAAACSDLGEVKIIEVQARLFG